MIPINRLWFKFLPCNPYRFRNTALIKNLRQNINNGMTMRAKPWWIAIVLYHDTRDNNSTMFFSVIIIGISYHFFWTKSCLIIKTILKTVKNSPKNEMSFEIVTGVFMENIKVYSIDIPFHLVLMRKHNTSIHP